MQQGGRVSDPGNGRLLLLLKAVVSGRVCALEPLGVLPLLGHARNFRWLTAGRQAIRMAALASHVDVLLLEDEGCALVVARRLGLVRCNRGHFEVLLVDAVSSSV